jgi:hypothetical protein
MRRQFGAVRHSPGNLSERGYQSAKGDEAAEYEKFITFRPSASISRESDS